MIGFASSGSSQQLNASSCCYSPKHTQACILTMLQPALEYNMPSCGAASKPSLKSQLRELYKRIHPDRFHGFPPARDANEKSFKMLQEYLTAAKQGDQGTAALPYNFVFYLHQSRDQTSQQKAAAADAAIQQGGAIPDGLHKVSLTLPPPARKDYAQPDQLPAATQASIGKLLSACGLQSDVEGALSNEQASKRLRLFVPAAAEMGRQREAAQLGPKSQLSMVRTALRLGRQVTVGLSSSLQQKSAGVQADILTRLAGALDRTPDVDMAGVHLMVGDEGYGADKLGRLWLHADASQTLWSQYLKQADLAECARRQRLVSRVKDLEATVAQRVGVSMLYTSEQLQLQPQYMQFLERIADGAATAGPVSDRIMRQVPLQVLSERSVKAQAASQSNAEQPYVAVSVAADLKQVYSALQSKGPTALAALQKHNAHKQRLEDFRHTVEKRLRIRRLARDEMPNLSVAASACCTTLLACHSSWKACLSGYRILTWYPQKAVTLTLPGTLRFDI